MNARKSGILLHPVSLPGPFGIGDLGENAVRFADWLHDTGQSLWQVLPLGPTGPDRSPYMSYSAFAGNPLLIDPWHLVRAGWLSSDALPRGDLPNGHRVDYDNAARLKWNVLQLAYAGFERAGGSHDPDFHDFRERHAPWLEDHALFMTLKARFSGLPWQRWPNELASADADALTRVRNSAASELRFHEFVQYVFFRQWQALRDYCTQRGVLFIGDLPLYVALDSSDVWANRAWFQLDRYGQPTAVAGVPPDYFSATGQRWGNPLYRWKHMADDDYGWWAERMRVNFELVSWLRLDHFRGFQAYWEVPADDLDTTRNGAWVQGPGAALFHSVERALDRADIAYRFIAEDLGVITSDVDALRDHLGYPGMRILQMAFGDDPKAPEYLPHNHVRDCVVYTATHDHNTSRGWFTAEPGSQTAQTREQVEHERRHALNYLGTDGREIHWDMIRLALGSVADTAIVPLQDVMGLDSDARMNLPGTTSGNWAWRFRWEDISEQARDRLRSLARVFERAPVAQGPSRR